MIVGRFERGRPFLRGDIWIPRFRLWVAVNFLVDTGADVTCLHPYDAIPANMPFDRLDNPTANRGIGGQSSYDDFSKAIELMPDFANAYYNRAWVWRRRGEHGNAIIDFSQAIAHKPDYAVAYHHRGQSYLFAGDRDNAQADFETARSLGFRP